MKEQNHNEDRTRLPVIAASREVDVQTPYCEDAPFTRVGLSYELVEFPEFVSRI